ELFYSSKPIIMYSLGDFSIPNLSSDACRELAKPVMLMKVKNAIDNMASFEALGPDGFQAYFFKKFFNFVGHEVWNTVNRAFLGETISPSFLETHIVNYGVWDPEAVSRRGSRISYLMFTDDLLLLCKANKSQVPHIIFSLTFFFSKSSGMKVMA
ncbi:hypothetical protein PIB30_019887, partial [Stylosanthes scabra]|nr:hypothetical protein [Stylosanthes scabra]